MASNTPKKIHGEFIQVAGSYYELPVDKSLNQIHLELQQEAPQDNLLESSNSKCRTGKYSRNLIRRAIKDLSNNISEQNGQSIYEGIFCRRADHPLPTADSIDTHPVVIEWEIVDFIKAAARARDYFGKKQISFEEFAKKALDFLAQDLLGSNSDENGININGDFRKYQLLKEPYIQDHIVSRYQSDLLRRLDCVYSLAINQPASTAVNTMRQAIPALDNLIIDLGQVTHAFQQNRPSASSTMKHLYHSLRSVRTSISEVPEGAAYFQKFRFRLQNDSQDILSNLYDKFDKSPLERENKAENIKESVTYYQQYLCAYVAENEAYTMQQIQEFINSYNDLSSYIRKYPSDEDLRKSVFDELCSYTRNLFRDAESCDYLPYAYTEYRPQSASVAFISERTKYAHDHIRAAIHKPLQLLHTYAYMKLFHFDDAPPLSIPIFSLQVPLDLWRTEMESSCQNLKESYPDLPLLGTTNRIPISDFMEVYDSLARPIFADSAFSEDELTQAEDIIYSSTSYMPFINSGAKILKANSQLVASKIANDATKEIVKMYHALNDLLKFPT